MSNSNLIGILNTKIKKRKLNLWNTICRFPYRLLYSEVNKQHYRHTWFSISSSSNKKVKVDGSEENKCCIKQRTSPNPPSAITHFPKNFNKMVEPLLQGATITFVWSMNQVKKTKTRKSMYMGKRPQLTAILCYI